MNDLYLPSGMHNHLLDSSVGGAPEHPSLRNIKDDMARVKEELSKEVFAARGVAGGAVDPEDPTISFMNASLRKIEDSLTTIKASLGGEVVRFDSSAFHSSADVAGSLAYPECWSGWVQSGLLLRRCVNARSASR